MLDRIRDLRGVELDAQGYLDDFWKHADQARGGFWKIERRQDFQEPEEPSWAAMMAGDWDRALNLIAEMRVIAERQTVSDDARASRRIRVVEPPFCPYLQWEMHVLKVRAEIGAQEIRVLDASRVRTLEADHQLPEIVILGEAVLYEVLYDPNGLHYGGRRIDSRNVIAACRREAAALYDQGEDLLPFFEREIAVLPPPRPGR